MITLPRHIPAQASDADVQLLYGEGNEYSGRRLYAAPSSSNPDAEHLVVQAWDGSDAHYACTCDAYYYYEDRIRNGYKAAICRHIRAVHNIEEDLYVPMQTVSVDGIRTVGSGV